MSVYVHMYIYTHVYTYINIYMYIYIYIYAYMHICLNNYLFVGKGMKGCVRLFWCASVVA